MARSISMDAIMGRVKKMLDIRDKYLADIENTHVRLQPGNRKTGKTCWTISLIPIADCPKCKECMKKCYDIRNVCFIPEVQNDRARNSAVHKADRPRFWAEIDLQVKANFVRELRLNVGGDLEYEDFKYVKQLGVNNPKTKILFFTKNDDGINKFLDNDSFPENVKPFLSDWPGMEVKNPHSLPCAHVLGDDGTTTAPEYGAIFCGGNCSECAFNEKGCWTLPRGGHVIFKEH